MSDTLIKYLDDDIEVQKPDKVYGHIYRAYRTNDTVINEDGNVVTGIELKIVSEGNWTDPLQDEIDNFGYDSNITLPEEGLIENAYYKTITIHHKNKNTLEYWDVQIVRVL